MSHPGASAPRRPGPEPPAPVAPDAPVIVLRAETVAGALGAVAGLLVLAGVATQLVRHLGGHSRALGLVPLFDLDREANVPSFFSAALLLGAAVLLGVIAASRRGPEAAWAGHWRALAAGFLVLALDEAVSLHEMLIVPLRRLLGASGIFYFAWVVPALLAVPLVGLASAGFLRALPPRTRGLVMAAAATYLGGALGVEMLGGRYASLYGTKTLAYSLLVAVEEGLEMAGSVLFIYALLDYLRRDAAGVVLRVRGPR